MILYQIMNTLVDTITKCYPDLGYSLSSSSSKTMPASVCWWHFPHHWWPILLQDSPLFMPRSPGWNGQAWRPMYPSACPWPSTHSVGSPTTQSSHSMQRLFPTSVAALSVSLDHQFHSLHQCRVERKLSGVNEVPSAESQHNPGHTTREIEVVQSWCLSKTCLRSLCFWLPPHVAPNQTPTSCHTLSQKMVQSSQIYRPKLSVPIYPKPIVAWISQH